MKCYSVKLKQEMNIEGVLYPADTQIAVLTTAIGPATMLGLIQYKHAVVEEVNEPIDDEDSEIAESNEAEESSASPESESDPLSEEADDPLPVDDSQPAADDERPVGPIGEFVAAGLDQKTAEALVLKNNITSVDELKALMADPDFDLIDLDDIGPVRVANIKATFLVDQQ